MYSTDEDVNILWTLVGAYLVFFMQCGFAMLEAGTVRKENTVNILLKVSTQPLHIAHRSLKWAHF